jgi:hypothetical protein
MRGSRIHTDWADCPTIIGTEGARLIDLQTAPGCCRRISSGLGFLTAKETNSRIAHLRLTSPKYPMPPLPYMPPPSCASTTMLMAFIADTEIRLRTKVGTYRNLKWPIRPSPTTRWMFPDANKTSTSDLYSKYSCLRSRRWEKLAVAPQSTHASNFS